MGGKWGVEKMMMIIIIIKRELTMKLNLLTVKRPKCLRD